MCPGPKVFCFSSTLVSGNQGSVPTNGLHKSHTQKKILFTGRTPCLGGEGRRAWWELFVSVPWGPLIWSSFEFLGWWCHQGRCLKHLCSVQVKLTKNLPRETSLFHQVDRQEAVSLTTPRVRLVRVETVPNSCLLCHQEGQRVGAASLARAEDMWGMCQNS